MEKEGDNFLASVLLKFLKDKRARTKILLIFGIFFAFSIFSVLFIFALNLGQPANANTNVTYENNFSHLNISDSSLIYYMPFDVNSGATTYDYSINSHDGTISGAVFNSSGKYGSSYWFDTQGDYINMTETSDLQIFDKNFTFVAWVYPNSYVFSGQGNGGIFGGESGSASLVLQSTGRPSVSSVSVSAAPECTIAPQLNQWTFIAVTFNSYATSNNLVYYVNGSSQTVTFNTDFNSGAGSIYIGQRASGSNSFPGNIDEVMLFNRVLSATEIAQIYNSTYSRFYPAGEMLFQNNNFGTNNTVNITLNDCRTLNGSILSAKINDGNYVDFSNCVINNYSVSGDLTSANLSVKFNSTPYNFYSPLVVGNITLDSYSGSGEVAPQITINSPLNQTYGLGTITLNITANNSISSCWYSFNGGVNNYTLTNLTQNDWTATNSSVPEGINTVNFYCNNTNNTLGQSSVSFTMDLTGPAVNSNFINNTLFSTDTGNITVFLSSSDAVSVNYSIDGGATNSVSRYNNDWKHDSNRYSSNIGFNDFSYAPLTNQTYFMTPGVGGVYDEYGSCVVKDDAVYCTAKTYQANSGNNNFTVINATNGSIIWQFDMKGDSDTTPMLDISNESVMWVPTYDEGGVTFEGIYKIDLLNRNQMCNISLGNNGFAVGIEQDANKVYGCVGYSATQICYAINKNDCSQNWSYNTDSDWSDVAGQPFVYGDYLVILGIGANALKVLNSTNGSLIWQNSLQDTYWDNQCRVLGNQDLWCTSADSTESVNNVTVYNITNGNVLWNQPFGRMHSKFTLYNDKVMFSSRTSRTVYVLNYSDANHAQICNLTVPQVSSSNEKLYHEPVCANDVCYVGSNDNLNGNPGMLLAFNATNCSTIWTYTNSTMGFWNKPAITDGILYIKADGTGDLIAFGTEKKYTYFTNFTGSGGEHTINVTAYDIFGNANSVIYNFSLTSEGDTSKPAYSLNQTNNTIANESTLFSLYVNDSIALNNNGYYIFSTNNTGVWANDSAVNFTETPSWANVTKTLNSTANISIGYRWYLFDNAGNSNVTNVFSLTTGLNCGSLSTENAIYNLTGNVTSTGTCFTISANNITLDCNGYWINYSLAGLIDTYGVRSARNNTIIRNCNIFDGNRTSSATSRHGIYLSTSFNSQLENNFVNVSNGYGIYILSSEGKTIDSNIVFSVSNRVIQITSSKNNTLINNTATSVSGRTFQLSTSSNNTLINNTGISVSSRGIYLDSSSNNSIISTNASGAYAYYIQASYNNNITDCAYSFGSTNDIYVHSDAGSVENIFLNCSYSTETVEGASNYLIRKWYFDGNVSYSNGTAISGANLTIYNLSSVNVYSQSTDSNGDITRQEISEYTNLGGTKTYSSPYTVNVTKTGFTTNSTSYNLTSLNNVFATIYLSGEAGDTTSPTYSLNQTSNTLANESTLFSLYVNDSGLHNNGYYIFSTNNTGIWVNDSAVNFTETPSWANVTKTLNSTAGISIGYRWYLFDNAGNSNVTGIFSLITELNCGVLSTANTAYTLAGNLTSSGTCFTVSADNVTIDCNGYWINYSLAGGTNTRGIYVTGRNNITIKNCKVIDGNFSSNGTRYGIYIGTTNNSFLYNNYVETNYSYSLYLSSSQNNYLENNSAFSSSTRAIYLSSSNGNTLINNSGNSTGSTGIHISSSSNNIFANNTGTSTISRGLYLVSNSQNNSFTNDKGNSSSSSGISIEASQLNRFENVSGISNSAYGIYISASYQNNFSRSFATSNSNFATYIQNSALNNFFNYTSLSLGSGINRRAINIVSSNYTNFADCVNISGIDEDVYVSSDFGSVENVFLNCSYEKETLYNESNSLIRKWYFDANISYSNGTAISGANLTIYNSSSAEIFSQSTNLNGDITRQELIEYIDSEVRTYYSPYTVNVTKTGFTTNSTSYNLTTLNNVFATIYLSEADVISPTYSLNQTNNTLANESTLFSLYVDNAALHNNGYYIFSTNNTGVWANDSAVNFTETPSWANVTKTLNSTAGISIGYRWYLFDNAGNSNVTSVFSLITGLNCGSLSTENAVYNLTGNVTSTGTCFTISANNITLDCNGYWINYSTAGATNTRGIYVTGRNNITIKNCKVIDGNFSSNETRYGIYIGTTNNSFLYNNYVETNYSYSLYLSSSQNNYLENNSAFSYSTRAIYLSSSNGNILINNSGNSTGSTGIHISSSSNNIFANNTGTSTISRGVYLVSNSQNNSFTNDRGYSGSSSGISIETSSLNRFENVSGTSNSAYGIYISVSSQNNFSRSFATSNSNFATYIQNSALNNFFNHTSLSLGSGINRRSINIVSSNFTNFTDCVNISGVDYDIYVSSDGGSVENIFLNCSYEKETLYNESNSLIRKWYFDANVSYVNNTAVENANLTIYNSSSAEIFSQSTDSNGDITRQELIEYIDSEVRTYYSPYTVNVAKTGFTTNLTSYNLTTLKNVFATIYLSEADVISPTYSLNQTNSTNAGESVLFSLYVNDNLNLHNNGYYIFSTNNTGVWANDSAINFTETPSWANVTKTLNLTAGISIGYRWYLFDNAGNSNVTDVFSLTTASSLDCGTLSTANTNYALTSNVSSTGTCFTISANNITLDCNDYWINYSISGAANTYGVRSARNNTIIRNCNIFDGNRTSSDTSRHGIYLSTSFNSQLEDNFVNVSNGYGIYVLSSGRNILNSDLAFSISNRAIQISSSSNNTLINNTATSVSGRAIQLSTSSNNTLINNTGISVSSRGIYLDSSSNNSIISTNASGAYAYYIQASYNNNITDCIYTDSSSSDVYVHSDAGSIENIFLNCSYSTENVNGASNYIIRKWYFDANVSYVNNTAVENANLTIYNLSSVNVYSQSTDSNGDITRQEIPEYTNLGGTKTYSSPYTVNVIKTGFTTNSTSYNLTSLNNVFATIYLSMITDIDAPQITIVSPANGSTLASSSVSFSITTNENASCNYSLDNFETNNSMTSSNEGKTHTASASLSNGDYIANYSCIDAYGNFNNSVWTIFSVSVTSTPDSGSPGGGSPGGGSSSSGTYTVNISNINMDIEAYSLKKYTVLVKNTGTSVLNLSISQKNLITQLVISEDKITLSPGESKKLQFNFKAGNITGVYTGIIYIGSKAIPVSLNVIDSTLLFDSNVVVLNKEYAVRQGDKLKTSVELIPMSENNASLDVTLNYEIKNYNGSIFLTRSETVYVEERMKFDRDFDTGILPVGEYVIALELIYPNGVAPSSAHFVVIEFIPTTMFGKVVFYLVNAILIILVVIIGMVVYNFVNRIKNQNI